MSNNITRRHFLSYASFGLIAATTGAVLLPRLVRAAEGVAISLSDPIAVALGYVEVSTTAGQNCDNCMHAKGAVGDATTPCALFQMKLVSKEAWCKGWVKKS